MSDQRVYSTSDGDLRGRVARDDKRSRGGRHGAAAVVPGAPADGVVRVFREKGGRGGKVVTVIRGLPATQLSGVASDLKKLCGSGGAVKDGVVEIQGDHREKVAARLQTQGHRVKLAGG